ncbi:UNVERIFIED_CONTAM: hypothetical protein RMT77_011815 [Armadillidium vulgare]
MNSIFKSVFQPAYCSYRLLQFQLPSISSHRYKSVGIQKKIRVVQDKNRFDTPISLLLKELEEETDYTIPLTPEHIQDQFEFRKLEMKKMQSQQYLKSIEYKYFREYRRSIRREPNLMTWAMKEHLVNLHMLDPDTWNIQTLSYAFPASPFRVSEILKTKLNAPSEEKVKRHDETVLKNWKTLTKGKFGSIGLLKKLISGRIAKIGGETLPAAPIDVAQKTKDLIFTPTGDVYEDEEELLSTPMETKKYFWFRDIITKYEERKLLSGQNSDATSTAITTTNNNNDENIEFQKCKNLDEIKSMRNQNYDDQSPTVQVHHSYEIKFGEKSNRRGKKSLTYEQFLRKKNKRQAS